MAEAGFCLKCQTYMLGNFCFTCNEVLSILEQNPSVFSDSSLKGTPFENIFNSLKPKNSEDIR